MDFVSPYKFPYLARQISGPIAKGLGHGIDSVYEKDKDFITYLSRASIDNFDGAWLDKLGLLLGLPRPWVERPELAEAFMFDNIPPAVPNPFLHALSTNQPMQVGDIWVTPAMGGKLDDTNKATSVLPVEDSSYKQYLKAACLVKKKHSIVGISNVMQVFCGSKQYVIEFISGVYDSEGWLNDILVKIPVRLLDYQSTLQSAFDNMFTTAPKVLVRIDPSFDSEYIVPNVESTVYDIVGNNSFSVTNFTELDYLVVDVTLGSINAQYRDQVQEALDEEYAGYDDITVSVTVAGGH